MSTPGRKPGEPTPYREGLRLGPIAPVPVRAQDIAQACMWVEAAARILAAGGLGAEAEDLQRVLDRVAMLRRARR